MSAVPPREWFEETFVHDGQITYCSWCQAVPFLFIGHPCTSIAAGPDHAEKITVPYRWEDVTPIEDSERRGDWMLSYTPSPDG